MRQSGLNSGNLEKDYICFAVPTVLSLLVFSLYSMVDGIFVGQLIGPQALAAVNLGAPFMNVLFSVAVLLAWELAPSLPPQWARENGNRPAVCLPRTS